MSNPYGQGTASPFSVTIAVLAAAVLAGCERQIPQGPTGGRPLDSAHRQSAAARPASSPERTKPDATGNPSGATSAAPAAVKDVQVDPEPGSALASAQALSNDCARGSWEACVGLIDTYESFMTGRRRSPADKLGFFIVYGHAMEHSARLDQWAELECVKGNPAACFLLDLVFEPVGLEYTYDQVDLVVDEVERGGAAERAGLRPGDRILVVDGLSATANSARGSAIDEKAQQMDAALRGQPGAIVKLRILRAGTELSLELRRQHE